MEHRIRIADAYPLVARYGVTIAVRHDDLVRAVRGVAGSIDARTVASAFVAGLLGRRLEHWSSLASFAVARTLVEHEFAAAASLPRCGLCGAAERVDVFQSDEFATIRHNGIVRTDSLRYTLYDLEAFCADDRPNPTRADRALFDFAISRIVDLHKEADVFDAERVLGVTFPSRIERKLFLAALGVCGILDAPEHPGFGMTFINYDERPVAVASPYAYPVCWWQRRFGVNGAALHDYGFDEMLSARTLERATLPPVAGP